MIHSRSAAVAAMLVCCLVTAGASAQAATAAPPVHPGAGAIDGRLYVYDAATGRIVYQYDTLRDVTTVNGVTAKGGSIDTHSVLAGASMPFVGSGYGGFHQAPGNVLLAFRRHRDDGARP